MQYLTWPVERNRALARKADRQIPYVIGALRTPGGHLKGPVKGVPYRARALGKLILIGYTFV